MKSTIHNSGSHAAPFASVVKPLATFTLAAASLTVVGCSNYKTFYTTPEQEAGMAYSAQRIEAIEANARRIQHDERMSRAQATELATRNAPRTVIIEQRPVYHRWYRWW